MIQNFDPKTDMESFIVNLGSLVTYLAGSVLDNRDLKRGDTHRA